MTAIRIFPAPAKLNLMLRVVGRRADGYHLLQTVFRFLDYGDEIGIEVRSDGVIERASELPGVPPEQDLAVRAAQLLQRVTECRLGADIRVVKRLPMGAGLGGGSSDAATVLLALNHLWETRLKRAELEALAVQLGADVPVFVYGQSAFAEGIGEKLSPMPLPPAWYVVLTPPVAVSTREIFADPELKRDSETIKMQRFSADAGGNDLEPVVCRRYPEVARHLRWLGEYGRAQMTGSGAAVFAAFGDEREARRVHQRRPPDMQGFVAAGIGYHPLHELAV